MAEEKKSILKLHRKKILLSLVLLLAMLLDLGAGALLIDRDAGNIRYLNSRYHHDLHPRRSSLMRWGSHEFLLTTNSLGFRDSTTREVALEPAGRRVLFIGDSFTEGVGVAYTDTFVGRLARQLAGQGTEVLNAGVVSYSPKLYHLKIKYLLEEVGLKFDELYVMLDISDVPDEVVYSRLNPRPDQGLDLVRWGKHFLRQRSFAYAAVSKILRTRADEKLDQRINFFPCWADIDPELKSDPRFFPKDMVLDEAYLDSDYGKMGFALGRQNMSRLVDLCRAHGIETTLVVYPWAMQILDRVKGSKQVRFWQRFSADKGVAFINLWNRFLGEGTPAQIYSRYFIKGDIHWNEAGHALVAQGLLEAMRRRHEPR